MPRYARDLFQINGGIYSRDLGHRDELVKSVLTGRGPNDVNARYHRIDTVPTVVACLLIRRSISIIGGSDSIT